MLGERATKIDAEEALGGIIYILRRRTDVKRVVIAAQAVDDSLRRSRLVAHNPVGLAVLGDRLGLRRPGNALGEVCAIGLGAEIEGAAL